MGSRCCCDLPLLPLHTAVGISGSWCVRKLPKTIFSKFDAFYLFFVYFFSYFAGSSFSPAFSSRSYLKVFIFIYFREITNRRKTMQASDVFGFLLQTIQKDISARTFGKDRYFFLISGLFRSLCSTWSLFIELMFGKRPSSDSSLFPFWDVNNRIHTDPRCMLSSLPRTITCATRERTTLRR